MSAITLPKVDSGHLTPHGDWCGNQTFNEIRSASRAFCVKCWTEVTIVGNKISTATLYPRQ